MKHILLFLSLLFAVQIGTAQETWNACNSTVTVIPAPSYDSTFVLEAPSRAALQKGMANWVPASSGGASYLVYRAVLTQSGTDAPVATVLENTLGFTPYWWREGVGWYEMTCDDHLGTCDDFTLGKTLGFAGGVSDDNVEGGGGYTKFIEGGSSKWQLFVHNSAGARTDDGLVACPIEILIYP